MVDGDRTASWLGIRWRATVRIGPSNLCCTRDAKHGCQHRSTTSVLRVPKTSSSSSPGGPSRPGLWRQPCTNAKKRHWQLREVRTARQHGAATRAHSWPTARSMPALVSTLRPRSVAESRSRSARAWSWASASALGRGQPDLARSLSNVPTTVPVSREALRHRARSQSLLVPQASAGSLSVVAADSFVDIALSAMQIWRPGCACEPALSRLGNSMAVGAGPGALVHGE